jgi:WD40 repeat protein
MEGSRSLEVDSAIMGSMDIGKVFKDSKAEINSMCFSDDGMFLVAASDDDILNLYNIERG